MLECIALLFAMSGDAAAVEPLALDPEFGTDGVVELAFGPGEIDIRAFAVRGPGTRAVARVPRGHVSGIAVFPVDAPDDHFGIPEGPLDTECVADAQPLPDGGLLVASGQRSQFPGVAGALDLALIRFRGDGLRDAGFGNGGRVVVPRSPQQLYLRDVAYDRAGRIYVADTREGPRLRRYSADGVPDVAFGVRDYATAEHCGRAEDMAIDAVGRIAIAGRRCDAVASVEVLVLDGDGEPAAGFGTSGRRVLGDLAPANEPIGQAVVLPRRDGRILLAVQRWGGIAMRSLLADGRDDVGFGRAGFVFHATPGFTASGLRLSAADDGRIAIGYAAGYTARIAVLRIDGTPDTGFGDDGVIDAGYASGGCNNIVAAPALGFEPDGSLVHARADRQHAAATRVVRLDRSGVPRAGFGTSGVRRFSGGESPGAVSRVLVSAGGGAVLLAGDAEGSMLVGLRSDGTLDPGFGAAGLVRFDYKVTSGAIAALDPAGHVVVHLPIVHDPFSLDALGAGVYRFRRDGRPDPAFGFGGHALPPATYPVPFYRALAVDGGSRVILERVRLPDGASELVRFDSRGTLDWHYGNAAVATLGPDAASIALGADGSVLVLRDSDAVRPALDRYAPDGTLVARTPLAARDPSVRPGFPRRVVGLPDGDAIVCGNEFVANRGRAYWRRYDRKGALVGEAFVQRTELPVVQSIVIDADATCRFLGQIPRAGGAAAMLMAAVRSDGTRDPDRSVGVLLEADAVVDDRRRLWLAGSRLGRMTVVRTTPLR